MDIQKAIIKTLASHVPMTQEEITGEIGEDYARTWLELEDLKTARCVGSVITDIGEEYYYLTAPGIAIIPL